MDNNIKVLKRGDTLFVEGEDIQSIYLIQSGRLSLYSERGGKRLEVYTVGGSQVLGDSGIFAPRKHAFSAEAMQETKYVEIPLDRIQPAVEKSPAAIKLIVKSVSDDLRKLRQELRVSKGETENVPCPEGVIHRVFTELHLIARHIGKGDQEQVSVSWPALKLYATRFFGASPQRLRSLIDLLSKIKLAELTFGKNEEGETELNDIKLLRIPLLEEFAEFYQYHLFKGARAEAIYVDPLALKVAKAFVELSANAPLQKGIARLDYTEFVNAVKSKFRFEIKNTHLDTLEKKGLFIKRQSQADGKLALSFDRTEFVKMAEFWSILLEIEKWNAKGMVDLSEKVEVEVSIEACFQCHQPIDLNNKFCPNCGAKLAAA